ncbi:YchJ family protein [Streptomyces sp. SYSU K217416]
MARENARRRTAIAPDAPCPCGLGTSYESCCGRYHAGQAKAPTAELLMRSRFSAFAVGDVPYLRRTWHPTTRPSRLQLDPEQHWVRLEILAASDGGLFDSEGAVEFRAHFEEGAHSGSLRERSRFVRESGSWLYVGPLSPVVVE